MHARTSPPHVGGWRVFRSLSPIQTVTVGFSFTLNPAMWLAGLAQPVPYRRSGIAPCPESCVDVIQLLLDSIALPHACVKGCSGQQRAYPHHLANADWAAKSHGCMVYYAQLINRPSQRRMPEARLWITAQPANAILRNAACAANATPARAC